MKYFTSKNRYLALIALLLSVVMLFSACGGEVEGSADADAGESAQNVSTDAKDPADQTDSKGSSIAENTNQTANKSSKNKTPSKETNTTGKAKTVFEKDIYGSIPKNVKKEVHILMWREYNPSEKQAITGFEKKTGIKVRTTRTTEKDYLTKLVSLVTAKDSPDVCVLDTDNFPGVVTKVAQPLDAEVFRLDDSCWYKPYMDDFKVNGKYFSVAMSGSWNCEDTAYVTFYSKNVMKQIGVSTTPYQLYQQGKWNWDAQKDIIMKAKNSGIGGIAFTYYDTMMYSTGTKFVNYNGKKFTSNMDDPMIATSWRALAELYDNKAVGIWDLPAVQQGKYGLFTALLYHTWNASKTFDNVAGGVGQMEAVPVAGQTQSKAYTPIRTKTWGVAKGAKNPVGAAYFLRYYLDVENIDIDSDFYNSQFKKIYKIVSNPKTKKCSTSDQGVVNYVDKTAWDKLQYQLATTTPAQIETVLKSKKSTINNSVNTANKDIARVR